MEMSLALGISREGSDATGIAEDIRWNLALANRILAARKIVDAYGHVSHRSPLQDNRFYISRSMAPGSVTPDDILELDFDGNPVASGASATYLERFIHSEIYRRRPDVTAVIHSHSPAVLPFSVVKGQPLRCVCHTAGFIGISTPIFEISDIAGDGSDLLVSDSRLGAALAECLADKALVLMRGHGSTVVGATLRLAVFNAVQAEVNARIQCEAIRLGPVTYLTEAEAKSATLSDSGVARAWDLWVAEVEPDLIAASLRGAAV
jgi:ribulose-5-phosphate 4-epimerase/fuculose-1-phosphate aldolase